jgi:Transposase IS66 family
LPPPTGCIHDGWRGRFTKLEYLILNQVTVRSLQAPLSRGQKLQNVIKGCRRHMFVFLANRAIPPTNNGSEQALRPCVIFRKVTNCFRSEWAAHLYADIRSVIETARRRAVGILDAIRSTLKGLPLAENCAGASPASA